MYRFELDFHTGIRIKYGKTGGKGAGGEGISGKRNSTDTGIGVGKHTHIPARVHKGRLAEALHRVLLGE